MDKVLELIPKSFLGNDLKTARNAYANKDYNSLYNLVEVAINEITESMPRSPEQAPKRMDRLASLDLLKVEIEYYISLEGLESDVEFYENTFDLND